MKNNTAGDPVNGCLWSRKSTYRIASELRRLHIQVSKEQMRGIQLRSYTSNPLWNYSIAPN